MLTNICSVPHPKYGEITMSAETIDSIYISPRKVCFFTSNYELESNIIFHFGYDSETYIEGKFQHTGAKIKRYIESQALLSDLVNHFDNGFLPEHSNLIKKEMDQIYNDFVVYGYEHQILLAKEYSDNECYGFLVLNDHRVGFFSSCNICGSKIICDSLVTRLENLNNSDLAIELYVFGHKLTINIKAQLQKNKTYSAKLVGNIQSYQHEIYSDNQSFKAILDKYHQVKFNEEDLFAFACSFLNEKTQDFNGNILDLDDFV